MDRRTFLTGTAALAAFPAHASVPNKLVAQPGRLQIAPPGYSPTDLWTFDGLSPGPEIRVQQGQRAQRQLVNDLNVPTSIHWHGIRIDNAMDGVPGLTQLPVASGETFTYDFTCPDAGTFWYHSHLHSVEQVERGLYGPLIVDEATPPDVDADHVLVLDDWRLDQSAQITSDFDNGHDLSHAGRIGNVVTTNGAQDYTLNVAPGDRLRLRLINAANARIFNLGLAGMRGWIVAADGMPVATPRPVKELLALAPAQRIDLIVDIEADAGEDAVLVDVVGSDAYAQSTFKVTTGGSLRDTAPPPLPPNPNSSAPDVPASRILPVRMQGGAMRWLSDADTTEGRRSGRDLAGDGLFWALNDFAGRPTEPLATLDRDEPVRLDFVNDTRWPHAMHLHGHHFFELDEKGAPGDFRDTTLVQPGQARSVLFTARNPGDWLLHCHMLGHHAAGMGTWLRVV